jgi:xanthine/uracil permease
MFNQVMSNDSHQRPMGMHARFSRWTAKVAGGVTILVAIGLISKLALGPIIGGVIILYAGLVLFPMTRRKATGGKLGFRGLRRKAAQILWMALVVFGTLLMFMITEPWTA